MGRVTSRAINGVAQQVNYDTLGRATMVTNALGSFTNTYVGTTEQISTNFYPNGQQTVFTYLNITNDERLAEIWNQNTTGGTLSKFDYAYDPEGQITNWTQQADAGTPTAYTYQYDAGKQLLSAVLNSTGVGATVLKQYAYGYDLAGNRTSEQIGTGTNGPVAISQSSYNNVNQIANRVGGSGSMQFAGSVSKPATVTVGGNAAVVNHTTTNFAGYATVVLGTNVVPIMAADYNGNSTTNKYQLVVTNNGVAKTISYDLNGNETSVVTTASTNAYQWDAANRMVSVTGPTNQSQFTYDGLGRRVQIIELTNGVAYATNKFVWVGQTLAEQRDLTGATATKRFFGEGEQVSGTNYFFARDHLGSVREVTDTAGTMQARYDYDLYGRMSLIAGSFMADFGFAGMYYHSPSGLNLTLYRAYDSDLGRWPNRDPLGERGGINLYDYVRNNPINYYDPYGLSLSSWWQNLKNGWNDLFPDPSQSGSEEAYWANMANNDAQIENAIGAPPGYMDSQRQAIQDILNPNEGFGFVGGEIGLGPVKVECMGFAGKSNGKPLFGGLGAGGNGVLYGKEWSNQEGGQGVMLLDPGAGYGFYGSKSDGGGFAYGFIGFPGFELFAGVGGGYAKH